MKKMALFTLAILSMAFTFSLGCGGGDDKEGTDTKTNEETTAGDDSVTGDDVPLPCADVCEDGTLVPPDTTEPEGVSVDVKAADGGTVASEDGKAELTIPAGALAEDTTITLAVEAASGDAQAQVYNFGPDGLTFLKPVTLALAFDGKVPDKQKAVLAVLDGDKWTAIAGSALADGKVTGEITHFSKFTIIFTEDEIIITSDCGEMATGFVPCGGNPEGVWKFDNVCFDQASLGENPLKDTCPTATMSVEMNWDATIEFAGSNYTSTFNKQEMKVFMTVPKSCLPAEAGCDVFGADMPCTDTGEACECVKTEVKDQVETDSGTWVVEGTNLVMTNSQGDVSTAPFCQSGDQVVVKIEDTDEEGKISILYFVLSKVQPTA